MPKHLIKDVNVSKEQLALKRKKISETLLFVKKHKWLYIMLTIPIIQIFIFAYLPIYGILGAFVDYNPFKGYLQSEWVGMQNFKEIINDSYFWMVFRNTVRLGFTNMIVGFPIPIIFALLLNEIKRHTFKKTIQTITYLPYFISVVAICGITIQMLQPSTGVISVFANIITGREIKFLAESQLFLPIYVTSNVWQTFGFSAIIYIAALTTIDQSLYESAIIDGANRFQRVIYITIPGISATIAILFILHMPSIVSVNFEKILLLYRPIIYETADVIPTYVYRKGIVESNYSYSTAVGMFTSVLSFMIIIITNKIMKSTNQARIF